MKLLAAVTSIFLIMTSFEPVKAQNIEAGSWGGKVRSGPGTNFRQVGSLRNGDPVILLENTGVMMGDYPWFRISYGRGQTGYKWGGILCGYNQPVHGIFAVCDRDNRRAAAPSQPPPVQSSTCRDEGNMRSVSGDVATEIRFRVVGENDETQFKIYWLDYQGRRQFYRHVFAGDTYNQPTFLTHPWVVTAPVPGGGEDCIAIYLPRQNDSVIVLQ